MTKIIMQMYHSSVTVFVTYIGGFHVIKTEITQTVTVLITTCNFKHNISFIFANHMLLKNFYFYHILLVFF